MSTMIFEADAASAETLAPLFTAYREFYEQSPDPDAELNWLEKRMTGGDCTVFMALVDEQPAGFTLLYPTFDSVELARVYVLAAVSGGAQILRFGRCKAGRPVHRSEQFDRTAVIRVPGVSTRPGFLFLLQDPGRG